MIVTAVISKPVIFGSISSNKMSNLKKLITGFLVIEKTDTYRHNFIFLLNR